MTRRLRSLVSLPVPPHDTAAVCFGDNPLRYIKNQKGKDIELCARGQKSRMYRKEVLEEKTARILPMAIGPDRECFLCSQNLHLIEDNHMKGE